MASAPGSYDDRSPLMGSSPARGAMSSASARPRPGPSTGAEPEPSKVLKARTISVVSAQDDDDLNLVKVSFFCQQLKKYETDNQNYFTSSDQQKQTKLTRETSLIKNF